MSTPTKTTPLVWIGPEGHVWPQHDEQNALVAGQRYQVDVDLATYLVKSHPDHWQRPAVPKAQADKE